MDEKEISYILLILSMAFMGLCIIGIKSKEPEVIKETQIRTVYIKPTPAAEVEEEIEEIEIAPAAAEEVNMVKHLDSTEGLKLVRVTCYLAEPGAHTADGSVPFEGLCAGAPWRIGQDCILYDVNTLEPYARLECRDTGGHYLLQNDMAVDIYKDNMDNAWAQVGAHGDYSYIRWVERGEE